MAATIKIKNSSTASAVPTSSDLVQGELAVNVTDKRIFTENASGTVVELGTNPSILTLPDGSASAPTLTNDGDTNTGIFFPTADTIALTTGGSERLRADSSGYLLVGTTSSPTNARFRAYGNSSADFNFGPQTSPGNNAFVVFNQSSVGVYLVSGNTSWTATSDERNKDIIEPITNAATKVSSLRAVIGKYKTDEEGIRRSFLIAQDVQAVLPEAVSVGRDEDETLGVQYTEVIPLLVAAIKELKAEIDTLKGQA